MADELQGKRVVVLAEDQYENLELWYPFMRLQEAGAHVTIVGPEAKAYMSKEGYPAEAELAAGEISADQFDGIVIPGGYAPDKLRRNPGVLELVRGMAQQGKTVAFICHAGWVPISAGIVSGRRVTSVKAIRDDLVNAGADWVDEEVVVDGNFITSRTPEDLPAFGRTIVEAMAGSRAAAAVAG